MKQIHNISLGGISFLVENEVHELLENYLNTLKRHYADNPNGNEIVEGIEGRIAELLLDKVGKDGVVTGDIVFEVLDTVGKPEEIFDDGESRTTFKSEQIKKKLYRNPDDKKIGGVLGGVAAYFNIDSIWLRIGLAAITLVAAFTSTGYWNPSYFFLAYIVMWLCMPLATTYQQKCEMRGNAISCEGIQREVEDRSEKCKSKGSDFFGIMGKIVVIFFGGLLAIFGLIGILAIFGIILGVAVVGFTCPDIFAGVLDLIGISSGWMTGLGKIFVAILIFLPCIALLYLGIRLIFKFKAPRWKPGLIMLLLWIAALIGICLISVRATSKLWATNEVESRETIAPQVDTLYVKLLDIEKWQNENLIVDADKEEYTLCYMDFSNLKKSKVALYPKISFDRDDDEAPNVKVSTSKLTRTMTDEEAFAKPDFYRLEGDTLFVSPIVYGGDNAIKQFEAEIEVTMPKGNGLIITGPEPHSFDCERNRSNFEGLFK